MSRQINKLWMDLQMDKKGMDVQMDEKMDECIKKVDGCMDG